VVANIHFHVSDVVSKQLAATSGTDSGGGGDKDRVATRIVLRDVKVLRTSTSPGNTKLSVGGTAGGSWVMLELSDNQVQKLYWVKQNADWWLALRPVLKPSDSPNGVETVESVLTDGLSLKPYTQLFLGKQGPNR